MPINFVSSNSSDGELPRRVLVAEMSGSGHRFQYVRWIIEAAVAQGHFVSLLTRPGACLTDEYRTHLGSVGSLFHAVESPTDSISELIQIALYQSCQSLIIPDGDRYLAQVMLAGRPHKSVDVTLLIMRPSGQSSTLSGVRKVKTLVKRVLRSFVRLRGIRVLSLVSSTTRPRNEMQVADPVVVEQITASSMANHRHEFGLSEGTTWFGIVGAISRRKNIEMVLESLKVAHDPGFGLVIAGKIESDYKAALLAEVSVAQESGLQILIIDRILSEIELDLFVATLDAVILAHSNEGSSGILGKASILGTPVLAAGANSLRKDIEGMPDIGIWVELNPQSLSEGMKRIMVSKNEKLCRNIPVSNPLQFGSALLKSAATVENILYLAVLPFYRQACMESLRVELPNVMAFAGERHIDPTIRTGISEDLYSRVTNRVFAGRVLVQTGNLQPAIRATNTIVDLNPRSVTAWVVLLVRRMLRRRTLVWGHLHPRMGASSPTASLRRVMRILSSGTVLYGYDSVLPARKELPRGNVWVAPNALYAGSELGSTSDDGPYTKIVYVGRLVRDKKVHLLVEGFAASGLAAEECQLVLVGDGHERTHLEKRAEELGISQHVVFTGHVADVGKLRMIYRNAICAVSPGYAGLSLTQSLGFGVPVAVSRDELHAPEIELARFDHLTWFQTDSIEDMALAFQSFPRSGQRVQRKAVSDAVAAAYSAEAMSSGLAMAFKGKPQDLGADGWPA